MNSDKFCDTALCFILTDLLPNRCQSEQDAREQSCRARRTSLTLQQKTALEKLFLKNMFPSRREKSALAIELEITYFDVQVLLLVK